MSDLAFQRCLHPDCQKTFGITEIHHCCPVCGELLDVDYDWERIRLPTALRLFEKYWCGRANPRYFSGVWRFHELLPFMPAEQCVTIGEGQTLLQNAQGIAPFVGVTADSIFLQYEGLNPSGSFKDNGMAGAFTHGKMVGATRAACASTGNTSASLALYAAATKIMRAVVFVGSGKIAFGKLSQALDYGAQTIQIDGDFDDAMARVQEVSKKLGIYLVNSVNPFRLEGQKTIIYRIFESLQWREPDWIVVPGGNLGNSSAFGKALRELQGLGLLRKMPRLAVINAEGASTLSRLVNKENVRWNGGHYPKETIAKVFAEMDAAGQKASTLASAIEILKPVNLTKCLRALEWTDGVVREVSESEIVDAKAQVGLHGFGCEPASAASVAGARKLVAEGLIEKTDKVVCILTGHQLKDPNVTVAYHGTDSATFHTYLGRRGVAAAPFANQPISCKNDIDELTRVLSDK